MDLLLLIFTFILTTILLIILCMDITTPFLNLFGIIIVVLGYLLSGYLFIKYIKEIDEDINNNYY